MNQYFHKLCLALVLAVWVPTLAAQFSPVILLSAAQEGTPWSALSSEERRLLGPHLKEWQHYAPGHQERLRKGARRYLQLSPHEQKRIEEIRGEYRRKSPEERKRLKEIYRRQRLQR